MKKTLKLNSGYGDHLDSLEGLNSEGGHHKKNHSLVT